MLTEKSKLQNILESNFKILFEDEISFFWHPHTVKQFQKINKDVILKTQRKKLTFLHDTKFFLSLSMWTQNSL
jgi:hypothetical protein